MPDQTSETDILIVGAGPVGLFLANECARRGLQFRIVETNETQSQHSKALAIFPRTLEIFDMAGLVGPFLQETNQVTSVAVLTHGQTLARMPFRPQETPYQFVAMVPQDVTERLLAEQLARRGGSVEYGTTFVSATEERGSLTALLNRKGESIRLKASFIVGCDGAHSAVRHMLKLPFEGGEYENSYILADVETNNALPANQLQLCPSETGPVAIFPMSAVRRRVIASVDKIEGEPPSLSLVRKILTERGPRGIVARSLHWSAYFKTHHRQVAQLRSGRIFIAGDAAHIHSPFGGQGMNTGLHDIWNLAWKLDLALRGYANEMLLDSYSAERRPVIRHVIETTDFLTKALGTTNTLTQILRDAIIPMLSRLAAFRHAFVQRLSGLEIAYQGSPIVEGAGERFFDDSLRGGHGILSRFLLVVDSAADPSSRQAAEQLSESFKNILEVRSRPGDTMLVRPDGYIAYAAKDRRDLSSFTIIRSVLERQTSGPARKAA